MIKNIILLVLIVVSVILGAILLNIKQNQRFVSGKHGSHCYIEGHAPKNIQQMMIFGTLQDCEKFINQ